MVLKKSKKAGKQGKLSRKHKQILVSKIQATAAGKAKENYTTVSYRADIKGQDEDDEEAEVPGQQCSEQNHPLLLPQISKALQKVEGQEENKHNHDSQRSPTHRDKWTHGRQEDGLQEEGTSVVNGWVTGRNSRNTQDKTQAQHISERSVQEEKKRQK